MHDKARNPPNRAGTISPIGFGAAFAAGCASDWHTSASPPASQSTHSLPNLESDDAVAPSAGHRFPLPSQVPPALANSHLFPPGSRRPAHCVFRCAPVCGLWSAVCGKPRLTAIFGVLFFSWQCSPYSQLRVAEAEAEMAGGGRNSVPPLFTSNLYTKYAENSPAFR